MKEYIPFTEARQRRLFSLGLHKLAEKGDVLCQLEWPDKNTTLHAAVWDRELDGWILDNGRRVLPRGKGGEPITLGGVPFIRAHSEELGPVSTEACLLARAEETGEYDVVEPDGDAEAVAADGGFVDHRPSFDVEGWDAVEYTLADAVQYDPYPVREEDARAAAEWAELKASKEFNPAKWAGYGAAGMLVSIAVMVFLFWLLFFAIGDSSLTMYAGGLLL